MTGKELKAIQDEIKFDAPSMAACLGIPYQTYRSYIYDVTETIPDKVERAALELRQVNLTFIKNLPAKLEAEFAQLYPNGI